MQIGVLIDRTARADLGVWEWAEGDNPRVLAYYREAGVPQDHDEVPWCAAFVGAVLARCGVQGTGSLLARSYATCPSILTAAASPSSLRRSKWP